MSTKFSTGDSVLVGILEQDILGLELVWYPAIVLGVKNDGDAIYHCEFTQANGKTETRCFSLECFIRHMLTDSDVDAMVNL